MGFLGYSIYRETSAPARSAPTVEWSPRAYSGGGSRNQWKDMGTHYCYCWHLLTRSNLEMEISRMAPAHDRQIVGDCA